MSKSDEIEFIKHIFIEINYIETIVKKLDEEDFYDDETLKRAITRALEIIGEATKNLNQDFRLKYNSVPWSYMAKLRDKIIHHYQGVDYETIWNIITQEIPELHFQIEQIIKENDNK
jgi:uncharacterized protein with HEPN domain